jgi:hypothetical protein
MPVFDVLGLVRTAVAATAHQQEGSLCECDATSNTRLLSLECNQPPPSRRTTQTTIQSDDGRVIDCCEVSLIHEASSTSISCCSAGFRPHSQTVATRQPSSTSVSMVRWSRSTLSSNFLCQNSRLLAGVVANLHPGCRCQKHPWMSNAALHLGSTISGLPMSLRS